MRVTCYGSRGSVAVSGPEFIKYGGDTTCIHLESDAGHNLIIDAGTGIRPLGNELLKRTDIASLSLLFTHFHWDHLLGFPFFKPLYQEKTKIDLYGLSQRPPMDIGYVVAKLLSPPYFPVDMTAIRAEMDFKGIEMNGFTIGDVDIKPIFLRHPNKGLGFSFQSRGKKFVFLTDNELQGDYQESPRYEEYLAFCEQADLLIHDAEYKNEEYAQRRGWGHSTYQDAVRLALGGNVKALGLFHHNQDRSDDDLDLMQTEARQLINQNQVSLDCFAVKCRQVINL